MNKIEIRNLDDLDIHPALKSQPRLTDDELLSWRKGMKRRGEAATPPIYITDDNQIVDGRHRYWCARKLGWKTIPAIVVKDDEVFTLIKETIINRRHYSKGQLAYSVAPLVEGVFAEAKKRILAGGTHTPTTETPESIAADMKISYRVLAQAQEIHDYFNTDKAKRTLTDRDEVTEKNVTLKEFFEPRILLVEDPDAPTGTWFHWLMWNIPPAVNQIAENSVPQGAAQGQGSSGQNVYGAPCPPSPTPGSGQAGIHHYIFTVYALDSKLQLPSYSTAQNFQSAIQGHVISQAQLTGLYGR